MLDCSAGRSGLNYSWTKLLQVLQFGASPGLDRRARRQTESIRPGAFDGITTQHQA
mgnify:CR=1 FL=1